MFELLELTDLELGLVSGGRGSTSASATVAQVNIASVSQMADQRGFLNIAVQIAAVEQSNINVLGGNALAFG
jgi:hypothetical protein